MEAVDTVRENVQQYYGVILKSSKDLKTNACCDAGPLPPHLRPFAGDIEPEVLEKFYGCGSPIPAALEGCTVLDLGCGSGRDVFLASRLAGQDGHVIGIDMTPEQLVVAERHVAAQMARWGFERPNVTFRHGFMEDLRQAGIADNSIDVVISDCVINLSPDKERVFREIFRVLKPGGELYFSDVFADRRLPRDLMEDRELHGECLAGAMYFEDFRRMLGRLGCPDPRTVSSSPITLEKPELEHKLGLARFHSRTIRAFKLGSLEDRCEDYGQVAYYRGTVPAYPHAYVLDDHHELPVGKPVLVCGNTAAMLNETRLAHHFEVLGDRQTHFGLFDCENSSAPSAQTTSNGGACC